jgi:glycosyltransferase involved in cell wall biosynthesis
MAAGRPVLVTNYSGHMEFVQDAGSTIDVAEFETSTTHGGEFALVDINDYVMKLDQLYYDSDSFWTKWGRHLMAGGVPEEAKSQFITGDPLRLELGNRARGKMLDYRWNLIVAQWASLLSSLVGTKPTVADMLGMEEM